MYNISNNKLQCIAFLIKLVHVLVLDNLRRQLSVYLHMIMYIYDVSLLHVIKWMGRKGALHVRVTSPIKHSIVL